MGDFTGLVEAVSNLVVSLAVAELSGAGAAFIVEESELVELLSLPPEQETSSIENKNAKNEQAMAAVDFLISILRRFRL